MTQGAPRPHRGPRRPVACCKEPPAVAGALVTGTSGLSPPAGTPRASPVCAQYHGGACEGHAHHRPLSAEVTVTGQVFYHNVPCLTTAGHRRARAMSAAKNKEKAFEEAMQRGKRAVPTVQEVKAQIPAELFQHSLPRAMYHLSKDIVQVNPPCLGVPLTPRPPQLFPRYPAVPTGAHPRRDEPVVLSQACALWYAASYIDTVPEAVPALWWCAPPPRFRHVCSPAPYTPSDYGPSRRGPSLVSPRLPLPASLGTCAQAPAFIVGPGARFPVAAARAACCPSPCPRASCAAGNPLPRAHPRAPYCRAPYVLWPIMWWLLGVVLTGWWVLAHECGHGVCTIAIPIGRACSTLDVSMPSTVPVWLAPVADGARMPYSTCHVTVVPPKPHTSVLAGVQPIQAGE